MGIDRENATSIDVVLEVNVLPVATAELGRCDDTISDSKDGCTIAGDKVNSAVVTRAVATWGDAVAISRADRDRGREGPTD